MSRRRSSSRSCCRRASRSARRAATTSTSGTTPTGSCSGSRSRPCRRRRARDRARSRRSGRSTGRRSVDRDTVDRRSVGARGRAPARARDRFATRRRAGPRSPRGAGALGVDRRDRRRARSRRLLHVPRRPHRRRGEPATVGRRVELRVRVGRGTDPRAEASPTVAHDSDVAGVHARGCGSATFASTVSRRRRGRPTSLKGDMTPVVLGGRAPRTPRRDRVRPGHPARPEGCTSANASRSDRRRAARSRSSEPRSSPRRSHTDYDQSAWMTSAGMESVRRSARQARYQRVRGLRIREVDAGREGRARTTRGALDCSVRVSATRSRRRCRPRS